MRTINNILKEINDIPVTRLEELYQYIHSLKLIYKKTNSSKKKIISFSGAFADLDNESYKDFVNHTYTTRINLLDRDIEI